MATWQRRTGKITAAPKGIDRVSGFLDGAGVIARLHQDPQVAEVLTITVLMGEGEHVAVVDDAHASLAVLGPTMAELTEALAAECGGEVWFEDEPGYPITDLTEPNPEAAEVAEDGGDAEAAAGDSRPVGQEKPNQKSAPERKKKEPRDPFDADLDVSDAYVPDHSVLFSRRDLRELVDSLGARVWVEPLMDGHLLYADGVIIRPEDIPPGPEPVLLVQRGAGHPSLTVVAEDRITYHWDLPRQFVPRDVSGPVAAMVAQMLGEGASVGALMQLFPAIEPGQLRSAISGPRSGLRATVQALGLPHRVSKFLHHERELHHFHGLREVEPRGRAYAWSVAMSGKLDQAQETVSQHWVEATDQMRQAAENMRVHAEATFDASQTFTEEVMLPARRSWVGPAVALGELAVGAAALTHAVKRWRGGKLRGRDVVTAGVGALAVADAAVNVLIFATSRRARRRS